MLLNSLTFHLPTTAGEAARLFQTLPESRILAGGTFLLNSLKQLKHKGLKTPKNVISLKNIPGLHMVTSDHETLTIGAMTTITDLSRSTHLTENCAILKIVCRNISTMPIRNMATVGGNLTCRYTWTEMPAAMIGLNASLHFVGADGNEEIITAEDFFRAGAKTTKILEKVTIKKDKTASVSYQRVRKSSDVDIPMLAVCITTNFKKSQFTNTRVAINSWTTFAKRDLILEEFLNHEKCADGLEKKALNHLDTTIYDTRSDDYKKTLFRVSIKNALRELIEKGKA